MIAKIFAEALLPPPDETISEWADKYRVLPSKGSAEPGRWRTDRTPYLREIMDVLSPMDDTKEVVFMKATQIGGPLALDTPIPTIDGWTTMRDIKIGDKVFDENGEVCDVIYVSPIFYNRDCYEITFSDGSRIITDASHKWKVHRYVGKTVFRRYEEKIVTTEEMLKDYKISKRNRYAIPLTKPLQIEEKKLPIHPYLVGLWLSDGNRHSNRISVEKKDSEELVNILRNFGIYCEITDKHSKGNATEIIFKPYKKEGYCKRGHKLSEVGTINGRCKKCHNQRSSYYYNKKMDDVVVEESYYKLMKQYGIAPYKRLPVFYLRSSEIQRRYLLAGLIDSNGHINKNGYIEFYNIDEKIADYVFELAVSLGYKPKKYKKPQKSHYLNGKLIKTSEYIFSVKFLAYKEDGIVSLLKRKANRLKSKYVKNVRVSETYRRRIVNIKKIESVPVRCIGVNSKSHLFLAGKFMIPTHNTEIGNNVLFYYMDYYPCPMLQILHTEDIAKTHMKDKLIPSLKAMDKLKDKVIWAKSNQGGTTRTEVQFKGGSLKLGWAQTPSTFASMSRRIVICDDVDRWKDDVGSEGNPVALAKRRAAAFKNKKIFINSSPTLKGDSLIEEEFNETDQRHYFMPCPYCGEMIRFEKEHFVYEYDEERGELTSDVKFACYKCGSLIDESEKMSMMQKGKWIPLNPKSSKKGYRLPAFYSPWFTWEEAFSEYVKALKKEKEGKFEFMKTWVNTIEAKPYENKFEVTELQIKTEDLLDRREVYKAEVPAGVRILTAGVDTQDDRFEIEVVGWGEGLESWSIDYKIIRGDPALPETQEALDLYLQKIFEHESGNSMRIYAVCVDTQGHKTQAMYEFCKKRYLRKVFAIKGSNKKDAPITTGRFSLSNKGKVPLFSIGVNTAKDEIYSALEITTPGPMYCHFPKKDIYDEEYFKQLLAEKRVNGIWKKQGRKRNEAIDCRVYARAALAIVGVDLDAVAKKDKYFFVATNSNKTNKRKRILNKGII